MVAAILEMQQEATFLQAGNWRIHPDAAHGGVSPSVAVVDRAVEDHVDVQGWPGGPHVVSREDPGVAEHIFTVRLQITTTNNALEGPLAVAVETQEEAAVVAGPWPAVAQTAICLAQEVEALQAP